MTPGQNKHNHLSKKGERKEEPLDSCCSSTSSSPLDHLRDGGIASGLCWQGLLLPSSHKGFEHILLRVRTLFVVTVVPTPMRLLLLPLLLRLAWPLYNQRLCAPGAGAGVRGDSQWSWWCPDGGTVVLGTCLASASQLDGARAKNRERGGSVCAFAHVELH